MKRQTFNVAKRKAQEAQVLIILPRAECIIISTNSSNASASASISSKTKPAPSASIRPITIAKAKEAVSAYTSVLYAALKSLRGRECSAVCQQNASEEKSLNPLTRLSVWYIAKIRDVKEGNNKANQV